METVHQASVLGTKAEVLIRGDIQTDWFRSSTNLVGYFETIKGEQQKTQMPVERKSKSLINIKQCTQDLEHGIVSPSV